MIRVFSLEDFVCVAVDREGSHCSSRGEGQNHERTEGIGNEKLYKEHRILMKTRELKTSQIHTHSDTHTYTK